MRRGVRPKCCRSGGRSGPSSAFRPAHPFSLTVPWPGCSLDDNGVEFPIGQIWSPGDPCELCICQVNDNLRAFSCSPCCSVPRPPPPSAPPHHPDWEPRGPHTPAPPEAGPPRARPQPCSWAVEFRFYRKCWDPVYSVLGRLFRTAGLGSLPFGWCVARCPWLGSCWHREVGALIAGFPPTQITGNWGSQLCRPCL